MNFLKSLTRMGDRWTLGGWTLIRDEQLQSLRTNSFSVGFEAGWSAALDRATTELRRQGVNVVLTHPNDPVQIVQPPETPA